VHYYRASHDGRRILMGGRPLLRNSEAEDAAPHLRRFMVNVWPELEDVAISHAWGGKLGFTFDKLPHIGDVDGVHYACGYLGSGVAMSAYLGHKIGLRMLGDPAGGTALDGRSFPTMPMYKGNPWFLSIVAAYYRVRDALG
jgi:glycine/D-amino acid oxidase-like deaminating enzyme